MCSRLRFCHVSIAKWHQFHSSVRDKSHQKSVWSFVVIRFFFQSITGGDHTLNLQAKEIKRPSKVITPPVPPVQTTLSDFSSIPSTISSLSHHLHHPNSQPLNSLNKQSGGGSAFGLQSLLEASSRAQSATPTTPPPTKTKLQVRTTLVRVSWKKT